VAKKSSPGPAAEAVPICGIGASAGGVKALQGLFRDLPTDLGLAYVVIVHLAPDHPSALREILAAATKMPVHQVVDSPKLKPNCVYVIPPDRELVIADHSLEARAFTEKRGTRAPIDMFFRSIAISRGDGMAVVLTGAGSDGAAGIRALKAAGGVVFVQDPREAEFPSMPQSAIATGVADFVLPIPAMVERITEIARSKEAVRSLDQDRAANDLRRIVSFLHARTGHDFSSYKRATVMRRVLRRMQVRRLGSLGAYAQLLQDEPEESQDLFRDLLISVTQFFRDPQAFEALAKEAIAPLVGEASKEGLRIWVPGCATGEEAYTIAILIQEEMTRRKLHVPVQIFATDLDDGSLATAREGLYPAGIVADLTPERLSEFFLEEGSHYRIRREIREMVLFANHSVLKDPPFLRLDLISCRNLLIYLERSLQEKLCALFSYALRPHRYLFLGSAETADVALNLFSPVNRDARLYRSKPNEARSLPVFVQRYQTSLEKEAHHPRPNSHDPAATEPARIHADAIESLAPPSAIVGEGHRILHLSPNAGQYILHSGGPFSERVSAVVRPELRLDLGHALDRALEAGQSTLTLPIPVAFNGITRRIAMNVVPLADERHTPRALVLFIDGGAVEQDSQEIEASEAKPDERRRLHAELKAAKEALASTRADRDLVIQELRAANEELQSMNEEYRSTAEELETSKEELQSMNEELQTVNSELKNKLESISSAHSDLRNLTAATEVGTLFLDADLRIRMFTPPVAELFNITETDVGRPLTDFTTRLRRDGIENDLREVVRELAPIETEVESMAGRCFMMRLRPYRTLEDRIDGVVITFVDITSRREGERERELLTQELSHRVKNTLAVVQGMATQTSREISSVEEFRDTFIARLQALSRAHGLLLASQWKSAELDQLVAEILEVYDSAKGAAISVEGPPVTLRPKQGLGLGLIMHELSSNAAKYGALSTPEGRLAVRWTVEESDGEPRRLRLCWRETGGPQVKEARKKGFGTRLIERSSQSELHDSAELNFDPDGFSAEIDFPID
jgi:chemotaxis methyl-accepting protein methylase/two-component sensor histidine kinase